MVADHSYTSSTARGCDTHLPLCRVGGTTRETVTTLPVTSHSVRDRYVGSLG